MKDSIESAAFLSFVCAFFTLPANLAIKAYFWLSNGNWIDFPILLAIFQVFDNNKARDAIHPWISTAFVGFNKMIVWLLSVETWVFVMVFFILIGLILLAVCAALEPSPKNTFPN